MRISNLRIRNFRAIVELSISGVSDAVVLAGPNGCGKSCILDAIRLLKSTYGSYEQDEIQQFFGEYQFDARRELRKAVNLLQDRSRPMQIAAEFTFSEEERRYLRENLRILATNRIYRQLTQNQGHIVPGEMMPHTVSKAFIELKPQVDAHLPQLMRDLSSALEQPEHHASLEVGVDGSVGMAPNEFLGLIFTTYIPQHIGSAACWAGASGEAHSPRGCHAACCNRRSCPQAISARACVFHAPVERPEFGKSMRC